MKYYMKSKLFRIKENFWIKNEDKEEVFFIDKKLISIGMQCDILKEDRVRYSVKEKVVRFLPTYEVLDNKEIIAQVRKKITFFRDKIKINSKYGNFMVKGDIFDLNYKIYQDDKVVAKVDRSLFALTDNYEVDINFLDEAFILSLVVIIDDIIDKQKEKKEKKKKDKK